MNRIIQEQLEKLLQEDWDDGYEKYSLIGQSGNAFSILGYTAKCMKECGLKDEVKEMQEKATSSDYNNLLSVCNEYVQRCNDIACGLDESCDKDELQESMHEIDRKGFASLNKEGDSHYYILIDGNYETEFYADTEEEAKEKFKLWQDSRLEEHLISERDWDEYTDNLEDDYSDGKISKAEYNKKLTQYDKMLDEAAPSAADMTSKMGSEIKFLKKKLMQRASKYGVTENFGQREIRMLSDKYAALENENPSAYASLLRNFTDWCANYEG